MESLHSLRSGYCETENDIFVSKIKKGTFVALQNFCLCATAGLRLCLLDFVSYAVCLGGHQQGHRLRISGIV